MISEYLKFRGILLPGGRLPWKEFRTTNDVRALINDYQSPVQLLQVGSEGTLHARWGIPTRLFNDTGFSDRQPVSGAKAVSGALPLYEEADTIVIESGDDVIEKVDIPEERPRFEAKPTATENDRGFRLDWDVEAGSRRDLRYEIRYRPDGGEWDRLATVAGTSEIEIDRDELAGEAGCVIEVELWDGFFARRERLRLARVAEPELDVRILHPKTERTYAQDSVLLEALTFVDDEMGRIPDEAIKWFAGDQQIASGSRAIWSTPPVGNHTLRVEVAYHGGTAEAQTRMTIDPNRSVGSRPTGT